MLIEQIKRSNKHIFTFEDDHFNFAYEDKSGSGDTDMNYADFPQKSSILIEQNEWLRNVGYLWCALGVFQLVLTVFSGASIAGNGFWVILGSACLVWAHFSKVKYSVFKSEQGNVFIIHDENHDTIISELNARRKSQLLKWYGDINPKNDFEQEIGKFKWLVEQKVMTKEEYEQKIAQVEHLHRDNSVLPGGQLN